MKSGLLFAIFYSFMGDCAGELTFLIPALIGLSTTVYWIHHYRRRWLLDAETLRFAIATRNPREIESHLRKQLALADSGETIRMEQQWLVRAQLAGLLVAEWRLREATAIYEQKLEYLSPPLQALLSFNRHELAILSEHPTTEHLQLILYHRDLCLQHVPITSRGSVCAAWKALEGLCLARMERAHESIPLLIQGLDALHCSPTLIVYLFHLGQAYEHIDERSLATRYYEKAMHAFPGTRLANDAKFRFDRLTLGKYEHLFRALPSESPEIQKPAMMGTSCQPSCDKSCYN